MTYSTMYYVCIHSVYKVDYRERTAPKISTSVLLFFSLKNIFLRNMTFFVIYGVNMYVRKHKFNNFEKNV